VTWPFNNRAIALIEVGRLAEARRSAEQAIQLAPRKVRYYYTFGNINQYAPGDPRVAAMEALGHDAAQLSVEDRIELHFALAKAYEDLGKLESSFGQLLEGNALKRQQITYDESESLGVLNYASSVFSSEFVQSRSNAGNPCSLPVFIIGMPRSGSTLVEQILASHPQVFGAGELKHFRSAVDIQTKLTGSATYPKLMSAMTDEDFAQLGTRYLAEIKRLAPGERLIEALELLKALPRLLKAWAKFGSMTIAFSKFASASLYRLSAMRALPRLLSATA